MSPLRGEARRPTYRILDKLSEGVASDPVFLAHHEIFDGTFVQKTVHMHGLDDALASNEPAFLHRLDHPRIVPVREAQWDPEHDRAITFVMPHLAGGSVADALLEGYRFSLLQSMVIAIDALDALAYVIREHHALHRDTKPGNILLDERRSHGYLSDLVPRRPSTLPAARAPCSGRAFTGRRSRALPAAWMCALTFTASA